MPRRESGQELGGVQDNNPGNLGSLAALGGPLLGLALPLLLPLSVSVTLSQVFSHFHLHCLMYVPLSFPLSAFLLSLSFLSVYLCFPFTFILCGCLLTTSPLLISPCVCLAYLGPCLSPSLDLVCLPGRLLSLSLVFMRLLHLLCLLPLFEAVSMCLCLRPPLLGFLGWQVTVWVPAALCLSSASLVCHCFLPVSLGNMCLEEPKEVRGVDLTLEEEPRGGVGGGEEWN